MNEPIVSISCNIDIPPLLLHSTNDHWKNTPQWKINNKPFESILCLYKDNDTGIIKAKDKAVRAHEYRCWGERERVPMTVILQLSSTQADFQTLLFRKPLKPVQSTVSYRSQWQTKPDPPMLAIPHQTDRFEWNSTSLIPRVLGKIKAPAIVFTKR